MSDVVEKISASSNDPERYAREISLPSFPEFDAAYLPGSVAVDFYFSPHSTTEHFDDAPSLLKTADIFAPEIVGWTEDTQKRFTAISKGDQRRFDTTLAAQKSNDHFGLMKAMFTALKGTYKPVMLIDARRDQGLRQIDDFNKLYLQAVKPDVNDTLNGMADALALIAEYAHERDLLMGENLGPKAWELISGHPRLRSKDEVRVLIALGFAHTGLYEALVQSEAVENPITGTHWAGMNNDDVETMPIYKYKKGETPTEDDIHRFFVGYSLGCFSLERLNRQPIYNLYGRYTRARPKSFYVGEKTLDGVMALGDEGLSIAHRLIRKVVRPADNKLISDIYREAEKSVASESEGICG